MKDLKLIWKILNSNQKTQFSLLLLMLLFGMVLEVFGIGMLFPILTSILNPEKLKSIIVVNEIFRFLSIETNKQIIIYALSLLIIIYTLKSVYLLYLTYFQNLYISNLSKDFSTQLYGHYLYKKYEFHIKQNSAELIKNFQIEINGFFNYLNSKIQLATESILAFSVAITLIIIEPLATSIVMFVFSITSFIFHMIAKRRSTLWGKIRASNDTEIAKMITEGLSGIKEILILGRQHFFLNNFYNLNKIKADLNVKAMTLRQVPRFYLELLTIIGLVGFILILLKQDNNIDNIMVTLGVFVGATFRMLPSINRILSSLQSLKYYKSSLDIIAGQLNEKKETSIDQKDLREKIVFKKNLELREISFSYEKNLPILNKINLKIEKGDRIGIIGSSGAGKTTLINIIVGLLSQNSGNLILDGTKLSKKSINSWKNKLGYVSQDLYLTDDTIENNIAFGLDSFEIIDQKIDKAIELAQLKSFIEELPKGKNTIVGERGVQISGGQRQRIGIARALYHNAEFLLLDEATSALDIETESEFMKAVLNLKGNKTILIITHRLSTIENCDQIYKLERGKLHLEKNNKYPLTKNKGIN